MAQTTPSWFSRTCADLAQRQGVSSTEDPNTIAFDIFAQTALLWDSGSTITYSFMSGNEIQQTKVDAGVAEWSHYMNICLKRVDTAGQIRITFDPNTGSWSYVGKHNLDVDPTKPTMNLGWVDGSSAIASNTDVGTILHEFGHALGLSHESISTSHGGYSLDANATTQFYTQTQGWSADLVKEEILDVYANRDMSNISGFSPFSVMRDIIPAEMNTQRQDVPPNFALYDHDKAFVSVNYPRGNANPETPEWTFEHALDVAGVTATSRQWILDSPTVDTIRQRFALWRVIQVTNDDSPIPPVPSRSSRARLQDVAIADSPVFCAAEEALAPVAGVARAVEGFDKSRGRTKLWPPGTVITFYFMQPDHPTIFRPRRDALKETFRIYQDSMRLSFQEVTVPQNARVLVEFKPDYDAHGPDSWSLVGTDHRYTTVKHYAPAMVGTTLYLNISLDDTPTEATLRLASCFHEVGHLLGLQHEHESPATETIDTPSRDVGTHTRFDPGSVMLYRRRPFKPGSPFQVTGRNETKLNFYPSPIDLAFLEVMYPQRYSRLLSQETRNRVIAKIQVAFRVLDIPAALSSDADIDVNLATILQNDPGAVRWRSWVNDLLLLAANPQLGALPAVRVPPRPDPDARISPTAEGPAGISGPARTVSAGPSGKRSRLWDPGNQINYLFQQDNDDGVFTIRRRYLREAFDLYERFTNLRFVEKTRTDLLDHSTAVDIFIWIQPHYIVHPPTQSWSLIGTDVARKGDSDVRAERLSKPGGDDETTLYINVPEDDADLSNRSFIFFICHHEIGHALGLIHEHEGPRTRTIGDTLDKDAEGGVATEFDVDSIMIYPGLPLRVSFGGIFGQKVTKQNDRPSPIDLAFLAVMYPPGPPDNGNPPQILVDAFRTLNLTGLFRPLPPDLMMRLKNAEAHGWRDIEAWRNWVGDLLRARYNVL